MKIGVCCGPEQAPVARDAGFDYIEVNVQAVLKGGEDDAAWSASAPDPARLALPMEVANCLVPGALKITGPERDLPALQRYMANVTRRAAQLGIGLLVLGSGAARNVPDGYRHADAFEELAEFVRLAGELAQRHGVGVVIEPLRSEESNIINRCAQELRLIQRAQQPGVAALVDSYHFAHEADSFEDLLALGDRLEHVHVAEKKGRLQPGAHGQSADAYDFVAFFSMLRKLGYDRRISIEGSWSSPLEQAGAAAAAYLRDAWTQAASSSATAGA